jgi:hypothetical protein
MDEVQSELGGLMTGLGVITMTWFPFALPALVMAAVLLVPLVVLAVPAALIWLLVRGVRRSVRSLTNGRSLDVETAPDELSSGGGDRRSLRRDGGLGAGRPRPAP